MPDSTKFPPPNPHPKDWVTVDPSKAPKAVTEHFMGRAVSPDRELNFSQVSELVEWFKTQPKAPPGEWYKEFTGFAVAGRGPLPLTVLIRGMHPKGVKLASKYPFGCVLAPVPPRSETAALLQEIRNQIDPKDLAGEGLDVGGDHITVRYGVEPEADIQGLIDYFLECEQFTVVLGIVDSFEPSKSSDNAAPLIIRIEEGKDKLAGINDGIAAVCDFTDPTFEYQPHITIAYVKPEAVDKYKDLVNTEGVSLVITTIKIDNVEEQGVAVDLRNPLLAKTADRPITQTEAFKSWFGDSKVVDSNGNPQVVYRGDYRGDQFGHSFNKSKSLSGGFFFTDDPAIASNYATNKPDTHHQEDNPDYANWYRFPGLRYKGEKKAPDMKQAWYRLSPEQKHRVEKIIRNAKRGEYPNENEFDFSGGSIASGDYLEYLAKQYHGNWLLVAEDLWMSSGTLFGVEQEFGKILDAAGLAYEYDNPSDPRSTVTAVYLHISHPIDTSNIPSNVIDRLRERAKNDRSRAKPNYGNQWDKGSVTLKDWVSNLEQDLKDHTTNAWTVLPDKVIDALQSFGYDGVKDKGGKYGGDSHTVWIAFTPYQIKSAIGNNGKFDPMSKKITAAAQVDMALIKKPKTAARYSNPPAPRPAVESTAEFKAWFGNSKVVDLDGHPIVVFHGAPDVRFAKDVKDGVFKTLTQRHWEHVTPESREKHQPAFFFAAHASVASTYARDKPAFDYQNSEPGTVAVYLKIENPYVIDQKGAEWHGTDSHVAEAYAGGHDGIIIKNSVDSYNVTGKPTTVYVVFKSNQIKSARDNSGKFDKDNPSILASVKPKKAARALFLQRKLASFGI